jgi:hypothetical protein
VLSIASKLGFLMYARACAICGGWRTGCDHKKENDMAVAKRGRSLFISTDPAKKVQEYRLKAEGLRHRADQMIGDVRRKYQQLAEEYERLAAYLNQDGSQGERGARP